MKENIQVTRLKNGLTVLTEKMPDVRSATVGIWLRKGARHEPAHLNGILHFIEHAVFKGTNQRSSMEIAVEIDRLGGNFDAFTMHEATGFMMKTVDRKSLAALELLAEMLAFPRFDAKELAREQKVIIEEMKMVEDTPEEYLGERFHQAFFPNSSLGLPIEGTKQTVRTFDRETTAEFHRRMYQPRNLVFAAAGNIEHTEVVATAQKFFGEKESFAAFDSEKIETPQIAAPLVLEQKKSLEQAHLLLAVPFVGAADERRYAGEMLSSIIGGGTSSRLWQKVREERGLAYSVGASAIAFQDCGIFSVYAGTSPETLGEVLDIAVDELRWIVREGVTDEELGLVKEQAVASVLLALESSGSRAETLARQEIIHGKQISVEETLAKVEAVTTKDVQNLAREFFRTEKIAVGALGNLDDFELSRERLGIES